MIACAWLPHFSLRVLAHNRTDLARPVAVVSARETHPRVLDCSAAARSEGVAPGMLCGCEILADAGARGVFCPETMWHEND